MSALSRAASIWKTLSKLEKVHIHRNLGVAYLLLNLSLFAVFLSRVWYSDAVFVDTISPVVFGIYAILTLALPVSSFFSFKKILKDKQALANRGNTLDTVYSNFFVQFQLLFIVVRTIDGYPALLQNPYIDFFFGIVFPQFLYRKFRPQHRGGARDVTSEAYNAGQMKRAMRDDETTPEQIESIKKWQAASGRYQSYGFCVLKWLFITMTYVIIFYGGYQNIPRAMLVFMAEFCLVMSLWQSLYPFVFTLKFRGVIRTEYQYWKIWGRMDFLTKITGVLLGISLLLKGLYYHPATEFPSELFGVYFAFVALGFVFNIKLGKYQDLFMAVVFVALLGLRAAFPV